MGKVTYKNLYSLITEEIKKRVSFRGTDKHGDQLSRTLVQPLGTSGSGYLADVNLADVITAVQNLLRDTLQPTIVEGLSVEDEDPISDRVVVSSGKGSVGGHIYELENDATVTIPFDDTTEIFYINLYLNRILLDKNKHSDKLTLAKIIVPKPGTTSLVQDKQDNSWNAFIVNFKEYHLYGDINGNLEEDSIEFLRDNISPILADNLIGNIRLNEDLKIINSAGTLELNSEELRLKDLSANILARFNRRGIFFYDETGLELAKFTTDEARIGNIKLTSTSIQSSNFVSGSVGFRIKDDGSVEFREGTIGGFTITADTLYGSTIKTAATVASGSTGVIMDTDGLRGYDSVLGLTFSLPTDGSAPTFSSGTINQTIFEISTSAVLRTSDTVGDGTTNSAGILMNNTGLYGCEKNQLVGNANLKALIDGSISLSGTIVALSGQIANVTISPTKLSGGLIEGAILRGGIFETSSSVPKVRIDSTGLYFQTTTDVGKYADYKYGDGTKYGLGVTAYLFNDNFPILAVTAERDYADIRLYNRTGDPESGSGPHVYGDTLCVDSVFKICKTEGSPGVFHPLLSSSENTGGSGSAGAGNQYVEVDIDGTIYKMLHDGTI